MKREKVLEDERIYREFVRDEIEEADVVLSTDHVVLLANGFPRLIFMCIFVSGTSGVTAILKYMSISPICCFQELFKIA